MINQILFQAILHDKLGVLDNDNVVSQKKHFANIIGRGISVEYVPTTSIGFAEPGEVLLLDMQPPAHPIHALCVLEELQMQMSQDSGLLNKASLRVLNESLCPYESLFELVVESRRGKITG